MIKFASLIPYKCSKNCTLISVLYFAGITGIFSQTRLEPYKWYHDYDVKFYKIDINASDTSRYIYGNASILSEVTADNLKIFSFELGQHMTIDSIIYEKEKVNFKRSEDVVNVSFPNSVNKGRLISITVYYNGTVPTNGFYSGLSNMKDYLWQTRVTWSLSESFRAKDWFPCKQYLPDKADSAYIYITVANNCKAGSNGLLKSVTVVSPTSLCYKWQTHYPIAFYLISFTVGNFQDYNFYLKLNDKDSLFIQNYIYNKKGCLLKNIHLINSTGDYIKYFSSLFGQYPFIKEKYGQCQAPIEGGMENQTMTTLRSFDISLVTHELAHQWFGDCVTCKSWQDIWLNEGFASYGEYLSLLKFDSPLSAMNWMDNAHSSTLKDTSGSVYVPDEYKNDELRIFNSNLTYKKGAAIIHQLRYEINNDSLFYSVLRSYIKRFAYSVADCKDFKNVLNDVTGKDYSWFFSQWYYGKGYPVYDFKWKQSKDTLYLYSHQLSSSSDNNLFKMHLDIQMKFNDSDSVVRVYQDKKDLVFKIPVKKGVEKILIDPGHWCIYRTDNISKVSRFKFPFVNNVLISKFDQFNLTESLIKLL